MALSKTFLGITFQGASFLGLLVLVFAVGCGGRPSPPAVEPTPETTPWLFPEPQMKLLSEKDYRVRGLAAKNLGEMGAKAKIAIPALEKLLESEKEPKIRAVIEEALKEIRKEIQGE